MVFFEVKATIFSKILQKKSSEPETPEKACTKPLALADAPAEAEVLETASKPQPKPLGGFKRSYSQLGLGADEQKELKAWMGIKFEEMHQKKKTKNKKTLKKPAAFKKPAAGKVFYRTTLRHRVTSNAYHKARKQALKEGKTERRPGSRLCKLHRKLPWSWTTKPASRL